MRTPLSVAGAVLGALALGAGTAPPAAAMPVANSTLSAAAWLATQLVDGERLQVDAGEFGVFDDAGLTADAILAFAAAGAVNTAATAATSWLTEPENVAAYIGDGVDESYAGATAKLALVAQVRGLDPTDIGGVDLLARLDDLAAETGRFTDRSEFGDFSNVIGQSLAIVVLERDDTVPAIAVELLLESQCADGGFDLTLEPAAGECESSADPTGFAVEALLAAGLPATDPDVAAALDHLETVQSSSGGFGGDAEAGTGENANSTGLAGLALRSGGRTEAADAAVIFLRSLQVGCSAPITRHGAISLDASGFDRATAARATAQAVLGLAGVPLATLSAAGAAPLPGTTGCGASPPACEDITPVEFPDVSADNVHALAIGCLAATTPPIIAGNANGNFEPGASLSRGQVASLIVRLLQASNATVLAGPFNPFVDVPSDTTHGAAIGSLLEMGIISGFPDGTYRPGEPVSRGALASIVVRAWPALTGVPLTAGADAFPDDTGSVHERALNAAAAAGLIRGTADGSASEEASARRDQTASVLARVLDGARFVPT